MQERMNYKEIASRVRKDLVKLQLPKALVGVVERRLIWERFDRDVKSLAKYVEDHAAA